MIERFELNKRYRYLGTKRGYEWNSSGFMDFLLDHKPRRVIQIDRGDRVRFDDVPKSGDVIWYFDAESLALFEEVPKKKELFA
jgi:hypothetical protein